MNYKSVETIIYGTMLVVILCTGFIMVMVAGAIIDMAGM